MPRSQNQKVPRTTNQLKNVVGAGTAAAGAGARDGAVAGAGSWWKQAQQTWPGPDKKHCKLGSTAAATNKVPSRLALGWTAGQAGRKTDRQVQGVGQGKIARRKIQNKERGRGGWGGQCCTRN